MEHLHYFSKIYGNTFKFSEYESLLKGLQLFDVLNKKVKKYSLGMKQKLGIVISLLNNPSYVVLDEPTNSMDIETSLEVLQQFKKMANKWNVGIFISSHKLEDIETICDRILFLEKGTILEEKQLNNKNQYFIKLVFDKKSDLYTLFNRQKIKQIIYSKHKTINNKIKKKNK